MHISKNKRINILIATLAVVAAIMLVFFVLDLTGNDPAVTQRAEETATPTANPSAEPASSTADAQQDEDTPVYLDDYFKGTALDLTQYQGKVVLINFFTEWCPYCMEEMPDFKRAYETYDPDSLAIILIHPWDGEDATNSASVVARFGLEGIPVIEDDDFTLTSIAGVPGYPTTIIVDQDGYVYYAVASKINFELLTAVFSDLGVPLRDGAALQNE